MKKVLVLVIAILMTGAVLGLAVLTSCVKEEEENCDCTYYSAEKTSANPTWVVTYQSDWTASCEDEDFGTSQYFYGDGSWIQTRTYTTCN